MKQNILLCVAGLTPQIITESVYVLAVQKRIKIDEIQVITTTQGWKNVEERLFDSGVWKAFCADYPNEISKIRFDCNLNYIKMIQDLSDNYLPDIRTTDENELAANQICKIVKELTADDSNTIFASVAGGRKTMGNYLGFAMSLFARTKDSLSHVLVDEKFERVGKPPFNFYYEPPVPRQVYDIKDNPVFLDAEKTQPLLTDMAKTTLAFIPFVRLRRILPEFYGTKDYSQESGNYADFVEKVQKELDLSETNHELFIDLTQSQIKIADLVFHLTPGEMLMCVIFAWQRIQNGEKPELKYDEIGFQHFDRAIKLMTKSSGGVQYGLKRVDSGTPFEFLLNYLKRKDGEISELRREGINKDDKVIKLNKTLIELVRDYNAKLEKKRIPERYMIKSKERTKNIPNNWIALDPSLIKFIERKDPIALNRFGKIR